MTLQVKICGITSVAQGQMIAQLGSHALGYICVAQSARYVTAEQIAPIIAAVWQTHPAVEHMGVFANAPIAEIVATVQLAKLTAIQLHGDETPAICLLLRDALEHANLTKVKIVKALRMRSPEDLLTARTYETYVDTLLIDAYHPHQLGGTGKTLDWQALQGFTPSCPWFLAGGLNPDNVLTALSQLSPNGIDLSSGVERSPGDKDLDKVRLLFSQLSDLVAQTSA